PQRTGLQLPDLGPVRVGGGKRLSGRKLDSFKDQKHGSHKKGKKGNTFRAGNASMTEKTRRRTIVSGNIVRPWKSQNEGFRWKHRNPSTVMYERMGSELRLLLFFFGVSFRFGRGGGNRFRFGGGFAFSRFGGLGDFGRRLGCFDHGVRG